MLYIPRTWDWRLPFSIGKGSIAALEGARGARGSMREHYRAVCRGVAGGSLKWVFVQGANQRYRLAFEIENLVLCRLPTAF